MANVVTSSLQVDLKRRTTLPGDILAAAGIPAGSPLIARVEEPGRIVLESPQLLLTRLQDDIAAALLVHDASTPVRDLVEELFADRAADASLEFNDAASRRPTGSDSDADHDAQANPGRQEGGAAACTGDIPDLPRDDVA